MLQLKNIVKDYVSGDTTVNALKGVDLSFRNSEFVSILGQSGCGKTTLLNIVGGLDQYTSGDLVINGKSTKSFTDRDWDNYRNHKIGFVFQSYNLISHQSVLSNVELALTLSGVSKTVRRKKAIEALEKVGLGDQIHKKPSQMSGGQMQRVAIARALVNDPDILLADEPTGALDSETSVQIMDILKEISNEKLVLMVTHNPDLAEKYSTRIIKLLDGEIISDSAPFESADEQTATEQDSKPSMSFLTALSLSMNNLLTKKARTLLTSFAGSIGIIGIALILSVSSGVKAYIDSVQKDTLSSYPITIEAESVDATELMRNIMGANEKKTDHKLDKVYSSSAFYDMVNAMNSTETNKNNLEKFKKFIEKDSKPFGDNLSAVQYQYDLNLNIYTKDIDGKIIKSDIEELISDLYGLSDDSFSKNAMSNNPMLTSFGAMNVWEELLPGENGALHNKILEEQYDVIYGSWPKKYNDIMLIVDQNNEISDLCLYALGLESSENMKKIMQAAMNGEKVKAKENSWSYKEICEMDFNVILASDMYSYDRTTKHYKDLSLTKDGLEYLYDNGTKLNVCGILRPNEDAASSMITGSIAYTSALTDYVIDKAYDNAVVKKQLKNKDTDVINGLKFDTGEEIKLSEQEKATEITKYFNSLSKSDKAKMFVTISSVPDKEYISQQIELMINGKSREDIISLIVENSDNVDMDKETLTKYLNSMDDAKFDEYTNKMFSEFVKQQYAAGVEEQFAAYTAEQLCLMFDSALNSYTIEKVASLYDDYMPQTISDSTYEDNLIKLGCVDVDSPIRINLYASTFENKDNIADIITKYNDDVKKSDEINYTDYVALLMSSITTIVNAISYVLIAFVAISLIVSSIMIGIITYISVLERTKEIGILRAIGASKKDISRVFNAETLIIGFSSGAIGIIITLLLNLVINVILHALTGIPTLNAVLYPIGAILLVVISMALTLIAGILPSRIAAKKDPVVALRTE